MIGSWHVFDDAMEAYTNELVDSLDLMIMGRLTYQMLSRFWLAQTGDFADKFNRLSKIIYSRTLDKVDAGRSYEVESQGADDPRGTVGLLQNAAGRQRPGSVEQRRCYRDRENRRRTGCCLLCPCGSPTT